MQLITQATRSSFILAPATAVFSYLRDYDPKWAALCHKVENVFTAANTGLAFIDFLSLGILTGRITDLKQLVGMFFNIHIVPISRGALLYGWSMIPLALMSGGIAYYLTERKSAREQKLEAELHKGITDTANQTVELAHRPPQSLDQAICVARIILSISVVVFTSQPPVLYALNIACLSYSLYKTSQQKWIKFTQKIPQQNLHVQAVSRKVGKTITGVRVEYLIPFIVDRSKEKTEATDPCIYFCAHHSHSVTCLAQNFFTKSPDILNGLQTARLVESRQRGEAAVTYPSSIPSSNLTFCPNCSKGPPLGHRVFLWFKEQDYHYERGSGLVLCNN